MFFSHQSFWNHLTLKRSSVNSWLWVPCVLKILGKYTWRKLIRTISFYITESEQEWREACGTFWMSLDTGWAGIQFRGFPGLNVSLTLSANKPQRILVVFRSLWMCWLLRPTPKWKLVYVSVQYRSPFNWKKLPPLRQFNIRLSSWSKFGENSYFWGMRLKV